MAENTSKQLYESLIRHEEMEAAESVKFFRKEETSIENFLDEWKRSEKNPEVW